MQAGEVAPVATSGPPDPRLLGHAPELAALAMLDAALEITISALAAEHPTLDERSEGSEPPSLRHARQLLASACILRRTVDRYRAAVVDALGRTVPEDDDLPF